MNDTEKQLLKGMTQLTVMNSRMLVQIYGLHHDMLEKVLKLTPDEPAVLSSLSSIEQMQAALAAARPLLDQMQKWVGTL